MSGTYPVSRRQQARLVNAWDVRLEEVQYDQARVVDAVAFVAFGFATVTLPGTPLPLNEVLPLLLCAWCLMRQVVYPTRPPTWLVVGLMLLLTALVLTSYDHDLRPVKRLLHVTLYVTLAIQLASGRIHIPSAVRGLGVGLSISVVLSIAGIGSEGYSGRLTGFLGDPNGGGYILVTLGVIYAGLAKRSWWRLAVLALIVVAIGLTFSRTTLLALTLSVIWIVVGRRVGIIFGACLVSAMIYLVGHIPAQLKLFGPFKDRSGSDELRTRIIAQEHIAVNRSPWFGNGAGTSHVSVDGQPFFYHSSYLALRNEGGWICLVLLLGVMVLSFVSLIRLPTELRNGFLEASLICVAVCALNLGEVLLELPASVTIGIAARHYLSVRSGMPPPGPPPADTARHAAATPMVGAVR